MVRRKSPRAWVLTRDQGRPVELPRGWCHSLCYRVEARSQRGEGLRSSCRLHILDQPVSEMESHRGAASYAKATAVGIWKRWWVLDFCLVSDLKPMTAMRHDTSNISVSLRSLDLEERTTRRGPFAASFGRTLPDTLSLFSCDLAHGFMACL
jgi:hypothetical protein